MQVVQTGLQDSMLSYLQCLCHATLGLYKKVFLRAPKALQRWENCGQVKVVTKVESEDELLLLQAKANSLKIASHITIDAGRTQIAPRAPWFDRLTASIKFLERKISFKFREKNMYIVAQESGSTIPLVNNQAFDKSIKSSISAYMIFVKDSSSDVNKTQVDESGMQEDLELSKFLNQFKDVFIDDIPGELPPKRGDNDHAIELIPGSSPPNKPPYRVSQAQQEEIMRQVNKFVEKGMVRPSSSPFCSPVLLVHKKDGTYRMCVDYRALNRITIKNRLPVPRIEVLFDKLQGSTYFSRIDLKSGYHQIRIVNEDILKTAFCTTFGLYECLVMLFGLTNAPATFDRMRERIFRPYRNFIGVFFDDVIIYSKSIEEHKKHLQDSIRTPIEDMEELVDLTEDAMDRFKDCDELARAIRYCG
ncbi:hypothetical protein L7F22_001877 [Adiantum nelumboides]|nr:hypothetical protein [Adiantum nelumboides]